LFIAVLPEAIVTSRRAAGEEIDKQFAEKSQAETSDGRAASEFILPRP
jgi:hypothetical protein